MGKLGGKYTSRSRTWWTRERIIEGLKRFHADFGFCPTSSEVWSRHQQHTGRTPLGERSNLGWNQKYPSAGSILKIFSTFRQAWTAAGFEVDASWEAWTPIEDWFVLESVGILPRSEVASLLKRSAPAVKRRLYDLGDIRSYNRWGITLTNAALLMGISDATLRKYLDYGIIPYFRGCKLYYLNAADLLKVEEVDWASPNIDPRLDQLIRKAIAQRVCKMLQFGTEWRKHEIYQFTKTKDRVPGQHRKHRSSVFMKDYPAPPNALEVGDWIRTIDLPDIKNCRAGSRPGVIKTVYYSWQTTLRVDGTRRAAWVAMVEFPKIRTITNETDRRVRYTIPLDCLEKADEPKPDAKPLSMHPEAVRGRQRFTEHVARARKNFEAIKGELS